MDKFKKLMECLDIEGIKQAMLKTWNLPEGETFREAGYDILWDRLGEDEADRIYDELWNAA